jgi:RNA polymerase sigma-70 factor (ECF subfamily)
VSHLEKNQFSERIRKCALDLGREGIPALGRLYDLVAARVVRYAMLLTRNRDDAEDAVQAALVRLAMKPRALADASHPWPYFLRVVRNEALNIARKASPAQFPTDTFEAWIESPSFFLDDELKDCVTQALRRLPQSQSEVVVLKIWEEMTFLEISEVLGQSPNTIASRYRYAIGKLSQHLQRFRSEVLYE